MLARARLEGSCQRKGCRLPRMRWPWTRKGQDPDLIRRLEAVESQQRLLLAEWLEMYDKLTRRDERLRKRQERENGAGGTQDTPQDVKAALRARVAARGGKIGIVP